MLKFRESDLIYAFCVLFGAALYLGAVAYHYRQHIEPHYHGGIYGERTSR